MDNKLMPILDLVGKEADKEKTYTIYTDSSFDEFTKLGTYAIIVMQNNTIINRVARKCRIKVENSTECEIFAIYQAINMILSNYLKIKEIRRFRIKTDSMSAVDFLLSKTNNLKLFKNEKEISCIIRKTYDKACKKIKNKGGNLSLIWVSRKANKVAHKWTYITFKRLKGYNEKKEVLLINKETFFKLLQKENKNRYEIIRFLYEISNEKNIIEKTQKEISETINIPISIINKELRELIELNMIQRVGNGKYELLI